jgi:hypothetical protein
LRGTPPGPGPKGAAEASPAPAPGATITLCDKRTLRPAAAAPVPVMPVTWVAAEVPDDAPVPPLSPLGDHSLVVVVVVVVVAAGAVATEDAGDTPVVGPVGPPVGAAPAVAPAALLAAAAAAAAQLLRYSACRAD